MGTTIDRIKSYLDKHGVFMSGIRVRRLFRKLYLGGIFIEDGITTVAKLRAAIPKRLPGHTEIEYYVSQDKMDDGIYLSFTTEERVTGLKRRKLLRGVNRIRKKYGKEYSRSRGELV